MEENVKKCNDASASECCCTASSHSNCAIVCGLLAAALVLGICFILGIRAYKNADREVSVRGLCERTVMADRAIYPLSFREGGNNMELLAASVDTKNAIVVEFLLGMGFDSTEITIAPPKLEDRINNSYTNNKGFNYAITSIITVCTDKVDKVLELQTKQRELLEKGIAISSYDSWDNPITFSFEALNEIKPDMIAEANQNARKAAEQFARDSDSKLGNIKRASQGLFSIESRDRNTPQIKVVRVVNYVTYGLK